MNWLMYIGGFFLWNLLWGRILKLDQNSPYIDLIVALIGIITTWIWICWKFI